MFWLPSKVGLVCQQVVYVADVRVKCPSRPSPVPVVVVYGCCDCAAICVQF